MKLLPILILALLVVGCKTSGALEPWQIEWRAHAGGTIVAPGTVQGY
jgi:hypothetical protein